MTTTDSTQATTPEPTTLFRFREAYVKTAAKRAAVDPAEFASLNLDIGLAVNAVLAADRRLQEFRDQLLALPLDHTEFVELSTYAHAAGHAVALYNVATAAPERLDEVYAEASARRSTLKSDALNLAMHGLLNRSAVDALEGETGFRNVGYELMSVVALLREAAERIKGRSATLPDDLDRAEAIANELLELAALRESRSVVDPNVAENRQRAFTLMHSAYDQARRAIGFLRWKQGDADKIAPALYGNKSGRRRSEAVTEEQVTPVTNATPMQGPAAAQPPTAPVVPGGQGGNPFN